MVNSIKLSLLAPLLLRFSLVLFGLITLDSVAESSYILEQELATDKNGHANKYQTTFRPEWNYSASDDWSMTMISEFRYDSFSNLGPSDDKPENYSRINGPLLTSSETSISIKEWYFDTEISSSYWRIGKQQVVWGQADGLKILDVVNPQSYREFILDDFEDSRIPLWMLNINIPMTDDDSLQLLWIPDNSYNELAENGSQYQVTSELLVPTLSNNDQVIKLTKDKPSSFFKDSDLGLRYSSFSNGWDLTFNYLYHYHDSSTIFQNSLQNGIELESKYLRNHLLGASASNAFGEFTFRAEIGFNSNTFHYSDPQDSNIGGFSSDNGVFESQEVASVIGLDWQGLSDAMLSLQWFQSSLLDYKRSRSIIRDKRTNVMSFLYKQTLDNETVTFDLLALHGFNYGDGSLQLKLTYQLQSDINLWIGTDIFYGDKNGLFGQFSETDRITLGWQWGF